jgi:cytochrome d ubiquinol oxidase subunit I
MEFQFGTNWSQFARTTGGVIGQPLAMEGVFSFFLESAFLGLVPVRRETPYSNGRTGERHFWYFVGSWISGFFHYCHQCLDAAPRRLPRAYPTDRMR